MNLDIPKLHSLKYLSYEYTHPPKRCPIWYRVPDIGLVRVLEWCRALPKPSSLETFHISAFHHAYFPTFRQNRLPLPNRWKELASVLVDRTQFPHLTCVTIEVRYVPNFVNDEVMEVVAEEVEPNLLLLKSAGIRLVVNCGRGE